MKGEYGDVLRKLQDCTNDLEHWGRSLKTRFTHDIKRCKSDIDTLLISHDPESEASLGAATHKLGVLLMQEENCWRQRAKVHWLKDGDRNTKFFHAMASQRKCRNAIQSLTKGDGTLVEDQEGMCEVAKEYFNTLFSRGNCSYDPVLDAVQPRMSLEDNSKLPKEFSLEEFRMALFQMHPDKSPGPDGLNAAFYQRFWELCGGEIYSACIAWLNEGIFPHNINDTNIILIPKIDNPTSMKDFRPISLCNVIYKLVSKVLANRLEGVLHNYIAEEQSAFIAARSIMDNVMIASEIIHHMKNKMRGQRGEMALKVDIIKAYDKVEWGYLRAIMIKMGFDDQWTCWIMTCVQLVHYSVMVNYEGVGPIVPEIDLRQGDPLSLYLFLLCYEGLSALLHKA